MMRDQLARLLMVLVIGSSFACTSIGTLQRANTVGKGNVQFTLEPMAWGIGAITGGIVVPSLGGAVRYGVTENVDIGAHVSLAGFEALGKFQLTPPTSPLIVSIAPAVGGLGFLGSAGAAGSSAGSIGTGWINAQLPVLLGIPMGPHQFIIAPKIQEYVLFGAAAGGSAAMGVTSAGASVGFAIQVAPGFQLMPEFAFAYPFLGSVGATGSETKASPLTPNGFIYQIAMGLVWGGK